MPSLVCLRAFSRLSLDAPARTSLASRSLFASQTTSFSTTATRYVSTGIPKKKTLGAAPKKGAKTLNTKKSRKAAAAVTGKPPAPGERKAARKRIVLTNDNALEVPGLSELDKATVLDQAIHGQVQRIPDEVVDALRAVEAFKPKQGWNFFRRPATLIRHETVQLAKLLEEVESGAKGQKKTIRRVLSGDKLSGKSTLLLQGLTMAFLREWVVINLPEAQDLTNAHTDYAPFPGAEGGPTQYTQNAYTANLLGQMVKANKAIMENTRVTTNPTLPIPLPAKSTLKQLAELGITSPEASWPVFVALWQELTQPGRPPIMLALDGLSHIMTYSQYMSAEVKPIWAHDLTLVRHFVDHLSGAKKLPNGGVVLAATSESNSRTCPALEFSVKSAEHRQTNPDEPSFLDPYKAVDPRAMDALKGLRDFSKVAEDTTREMDIIKCGGLSKDEAKSIMEYYAESGLLRAEVTNRFVTEKWSLAGMGNIGELERASVRQRI